MKGAKNSSIVVNFSRDTFVEEIDDETLEEEEQEVPELETAVNLCFIVFVRTIDSRFWPELKIPLSEAVKAPIIAKEEVIDAHRDVVDGLQFPDEGVASLFDEDIKELLVEVFKEELKVRVTVPTATVISDDDAHRAVVCSHGCFFWNILILLRLMKMISKMKKCAMRVDKIPVVRVINKS